VLVSLMESSILSEGCKHLDSQDGALQCYYYHLNRLPASRLLLPRSGLERSDFVLWRFLDAGQWSARVFHCCRRPKTSTEAVFGGAWRCLR
jgi:hypothetical protein